MPFSMQSVTPSARKDGGRKNFSCNQYRRICAPKSKWIGHQRWSIFDYQGNGLAIDRNPFDGDTLIEWIRSLSPDLGQLTLETLTTGFTDEREAYISLLNRSTITAIAKRQIPVITRNATEAIY